MIHSACADGLWCGYEVSSLTSGITHLAFAWACHFPAGSLIPEGVNVSEMTGTWMNNKSIYSYSHSPFSSMFISS